MAMSTGTHMTLSNKGRSKRPTPLVARLLQLFSIARERRALEHMDDHILRDIGVSRDTASREAKRPAWDAPSRWVR